MYYLIRFIICFMIFLIALIITNKKLKKNRKAFIVIFAVASVLLCFALNMYPIENQFVNFETPEDVFRYMTFGEIGDIVDGEQSCLVRYNNQTETYMFVGKQGADYKILTQTSVEKTSSLSREKGAFTIMHIKNTQDYYVSGFSLGEKIALYDKSGLEIPTDFHKDRNDMVFFYVNNLSDEHYIMIDTTKIMLK